MDKRRSTGVTFILILLWTSLFAAIVIPIAWAFAFHQSQGAWPLWMRFTGKTYWDWLELLIAPIVIAIVAWGIKRADRELEYELVAQRAQTERELVTDQMRETVLQAYLDRMTDLLIDDKLSGSLESPNVRDVATVRTLAVLRRLDGARKGIVLRFLYEADIIRNQGALRLSDADLRNVNLVGANFPSIVLTGANLGNSIFFRANLRSADIRNAFLEQAFLVRADLDQAKVSGANLRKAKLNQAKLTSADMQAVALQQADLVRADLRDADLRNADMTGADLRHAVLSGANLTGANLTDAKLEYAVLNNAALEGADLTDAVLTGAYLTKANLKHAIVSELQLSMVSTLSGTILPSGKVNKWPDETVV